MEALVAALLSQEAGPLHASHLADELHFRLLGVFGRPQVFKAFSQGQRLVVRLILAAENATQEGDVGEPFTDWAGRSSVNFYPKGRLVSMQQVDLLQGVVWLRSGETVYQGQLHRWEILPAASQV